MKPFKDISAIILLTVMTTENNNNLMNYNYIKVELIELKKVLVEYWVNYNCLIELFKNGGISKHLYEQQKHKLEVEIDFHTLRYKLWANVYEKCIVVKLRSSLPKEEVIQMIKADTKNSHKKFKIFKHNLKEFNQSIIAVKEVMKNDFTNKILKRTDLRTNYKVLDVEILRLNSASKRIRNYNKSCYDLTEHLSREI